MNNQYVPHNGGDNIFIARYWEEVIGFEFYTKKSMMEWNNSGWDAFFVKKIKDLGLGVYSN